MKKTSKRTVASRKPSRKRPRPPRAPHTEALLAFAALANRLRLRWYVFGAQAVNLHGYPRTTADLDLTIDLGAHTTRAFVAALEKAGFHARFADEAFIATTRVIPVVHRDSSLPIDLVLAGPGLEQMFLEEVEERKIGRAVIPVLSIENLIVTKVLAGRPRDKDDIRELVAANAAVDHRKIESMLGLLEDALGQSDLIDLYRALRSDGRR